MEVSEFMKQAATVTQEFDVDCLCLDWLKDSCKDQGVEGEIAETLVGVVEKLIAP